jgi:ribA/ribD-fused uncharacterized protein
MVTCNNFERIGSTDYKERRTDTHVYFVGGPFSQWWASDFRASPYPGFPEERFSSAEQYMMAAKALLFHDTRIFAAIMRETNPRKIKELGRAVRNFDVDLWAHCAIELVLRGNLAKFSQNDALKQYLLATGDLFMVEGAVYDSVWGVKLAWDDPAIEDEANWQGTNWLGIVLMKTRERLLHASSQTPIARSTFIANPQTETVA